MTTFLTVQDVSSIHTALVVHFHEEGLPILPSGPRNDGLLESAIGRQYAGFGGVLKYPDAVSNASTLIYGLCMDHPFHNGNKRTSLVSGLIHLDKNGFILPEVPYDDLYNMIINLAAHNLKSAASAPQGGIGALPKIIGKHDPESEVAILAKWIRRRVQKISKEEHPIRFSQLKTILKSYGFYFGEPHDNSIAIYKDVEIVEQGFLGLGKPRIRIRNSKITHIAYAGDKVEVDGRTIKMIRKLCKLSNEDGVDSNLFYYNSGVRVDYMINKYRTILKKLSTK